MGIKTIAMMAAAACVLGISTGCVKQEEYDNMKATLEQKVADLETELSNTKDDLNAKIQSAEQRASTLAVELGAANDSVSVLQTDKTDLEGQLADANSRISSLDSQLEAANSRITAANNRVTAAQQDVSDMEYEVAEINRRYDMLRAMIIKLNNRTPDQFDIDLAAAGFGEGLDQLDTEEMGGMESMGGMEEPSSQSDLQSLLDEMGEM